MDVLKKLNYIFDRKQKWETVGLLVLIVIGTVFELLGVSTIQPLINALMDRDRLLERGGIYVFIYDTFHLQNTTQLILFLMGLLIVVYVVKNLYLIFMYQQQYRYIYSNMRSLSTKMMHSYLSRPYSYFIEKSSAELLRNINQDTADFFGVIQAAVQLTTEGLVVCALIVYLFIKDKSITMAVGLLLGLLILIFQKVYKKKLLKRGEKNRQYEAEVNKWIQQAFGGIKEVKVMNREDFFFREYDRAYAGRVHSEYSYHTMIAIPKPIIEACAMGAMLGVAFIKVAVGVNLNHFIPTLSIFVVAAYRLLPSFNRITEYMGTIAYQMPAVTAIYEHLKEIEADEKECPAQTSEESGKLPIQSGIHVKDLSFRYPNADRLVLEHLNIEIPVNTSVAFIGQSGAGKTTLADLILGVLQPTGGAIYADQCDIAGDLGGWHRTIGYVPQNIYLLDDTIEANIAFGIPKDQVDRQKIQKAIDGAQLRATIDALPEGVETVVGERGIRFSGGQRQRIGIARALYAEPEVLVLDEATSALDNETEAAVMESIDALHGKMTLIIIAHRLSTIQNCDVVYEIADGKAIQGKVERSV
jgi:ATP-binding cassette, subfamily B, bacterial PglK